jgi:hypothetical protein
MITILFVNLKRLLVLLPGLGAAYLAAKDVYPIFDRRLPAAPAVLITYLFTAYVIIPGMLRLIRLIVRPTHIPVYCTTPDGFACDPINIGIVGTRMELIRAMRLAGWYQADRRIIKSVFKMAANIVLKQPYPTAPFSNLYLFGRSQDLGFQIPVDDNPAHRHHVRFWGVVDVDDPQYREHTRFWKRHHRSPVSGKVLWLGAASKDTGIGIIRHNAQFTHMIHPDTNAERELIVRQLKGIGRIARTRTVTLVKPYRLENRVFTGYLQTDGKMKIVTLKS